MNLELEQKILQLAVERRILVRGRFAEGADGMGGVGRTRCGAEFQVCGSTCRRGVVRTTIAPLVWKPSYIGSQKYLLPDLVLERENETIVFDAKYKEHWEELSLDRWGNLDEEIRERHRSNLLQVLAYSTLFTKKRITTCLVYPCRNSTWDSLRQRDRLYHKASLAAGDRQINLILTAVPMYGNLEETVSSLVTAVSN